MTVQQDGVAARKQQKQQIFRTGMKLDDHTKFIACRESKLGRENSDSDRTKKFGCMAFQYGCIEIDLDMTFESGRMKPNRVRT